MEILDLYDDNGNKLNKTIVRGNKPSDGENIMLAIVFIKDKDGKYLIQKASKEKGGYYSTTGGHVTIGEDSKTTIIREVNEELGLKVNSDIELFGTFKFPNKNCLFSVFELALDNIDIDSLTLQVEEVESVNLLTKEEVLELIDKNKFLESHGYFFKKYIFK